MNQNENSPSSPTSLEQVNDTGDHITYYRGGQMLNLELPTVPYIVEDLVRQGSLTFLAGEEGCGKSIFAMNLGISVACGLPKFLTYEVCRTGRVLYLNNDLAIADYMERYQKIAGSLQVENPSMLDNFICPDRVPPFTEYYAELEAKIVETEPILVILDCLYWAHDKKENDSSDMKALMRQLDSLRKKHGVAIIVVHHTKKGSRQGKMHNDDLRGSGVFSGVADQVIQIRRSAADESLILLKVTKSRFGSDHLRVARKLSLNGSTLWFVDQGEAVEEEHLPIVATPQRRARSIDFTRVFGTERNLGRAEILERCAGLGVERTIDRHLQKAVANGVLTPAQGYGQYILVGDPNGQEEADAALSSSSPVCHSVA